MISNLYLHPPTLDKGIKALEQQLEKGQIDWQEYKAKTRLDTRSPNTQINEFLFSNAKKYGRFKVLIDGKEVVAKQQLDNRIAHFLMATGERVIFAVNQEGGYTAWLRNGKPISIGNGELRTFVLPEGMNLETITHIGEAIAQGGLELVGGEKAAKIGERKAYQDMQAAKRFEAVTIRNNYLTFLDKSGNIKYIISSQGQLDRKSVV